MIRLVKEKLGGGEEVRASIATASQDTVSPPDLIDAIISVIENRLNKSYIDENTGERVFEYKSGHVIKLGQKRED